VTHLGVHNSFTMIAGASRDAKMLSRISVGDSFEKPVLASADETRSRWA
jgi:hypothetical protein